MADEAEFQENVRRITVLLAELGHPVAQMARETGRWAATFPMADIVLHAQIAAQRNFVEFSVFFRFDGGLADFLATRVDEWQQVCYHYGCYQLTTVDQGEITLSVHNKLYFSGLQYYALKETLDDLAGAAGDLRHVLEPAIGPVGR